MEGRWKVILIPQAEALTEEAAQSMLKMLEEPPSQTIFLLIATHPSSLPPTIVSRCQRVPFPPVPFSLKAEELTTRYNLDQEEAVRLVGLEVSGEEMEETNEFLRELSPVLFSEVKVPFEIFERAALLEKHKEMGGRITRLLLAFCRDVAVCKAGWEEGMRFLNGKSYASRLSEELSWEQLWEKCRKILEAEDHLEHFGNFRLVIENVLWKLYY
jgi:DNA polymerase-3 subunit delta'